MNSVFAGSDCARRGRRGGSGETDPEMEQGDSHTMKKRNGIITFIALVVVTVLAVYTAIAGWGPTGTGAMRNIHTGLDLSGGVSIRPFDPI